MPGTMPMQVRAAGDAVIWVDDAWELCVLGCHNSSPRSAVSVCANNFLDSWWRF